MMSSQTGIFFPFVPFIEKLCILEKAGLNAPTSKKTSWWTPTRMMCLCEIPRHKPCISTQMSFFPSCSVSPHLPVPPFLPLTCHGHTQPQAWPKVCVQGTLVERMEFELLSEPKEIQCALGSCGSEFPLPDYWGSL